jgi:4-diphosphocytidyl-2-C-methyl-D-erythritol kinase
VALCPPKVNLYLRVVRRREDGFHELETVFQTIGGDDELTAAPAPAITLSTGPDNLVTRAALLLHRRLGLPADRGAALDLRKRTPMGAGLGGGSSDAATALRLLCHLWGCGPAPELLAEIAAELGSDVPFFLKGGTAVGGGRGEHLQPLPTPSLWLVLARPPVAVNTGWAYGRWRPEACGDPDLADFQAALATEDPTAVAGVLRNDLEPGVAAAVPEIAAARAALLAAGALGARMTGSGSVVFGIAADRGHAARVAAAYAGPGQAWAAPTAGPTVWP